MSDPETNISKARALKEEIFAELKKSPKADEIKGVCCVQELANRLGQTSMVSLQEGSNSESDRILIYLSISNLT